MSRQIEAWFPRLAATGYRVTSPRDVDYNCIAWAADRDDAWWWPDEGAYWPPEAPFVATLEAFEAAYGSMGYSRCETPEFEPEMEKVAIYVDENGTPTHAARQLSTGEWTSKLGAGEDIVHSTLEGLYGKNYGTVGRLTMRPRRGWQ